jgi:proteasome lid subunit RPN8/RPN11
MALAPFTKIVIDKREERKFRRRALAHYPYEHIEALWGEVRGDTVYVVAFMAMEHRSSLKSLQYEDAELDEHEDDAKDAHLEFLGTIHSHPDCNDNRFGDRDLATMQESQESVMGILAIEAEVKGKKLKKRRCRVAYWPSTRPLEVIRKEWDASTSKKIKRPRRAGVKLNYATASSRKRKRR